MNDISRPEYALTAEIITAAIEVHRHLGPGLLERAYEECLAAELSARGIGCRRQVVQPLIYRNVELPKSYTIDVVVETAYFWN